MIVLPARNEAPRVGAVLAEVRAVWPDVPVVVVENDSTDDTAAVARAAGATVLVSGPGYARALRTGFVHALRAGAPWIIQMDADGQHPAGALPRLRAALARADVVVGSRFLGDAGYAVPTVRRTAIAALGAWASLWSGQRLRDVTSGFRAWRPDAIAALVADYPEEVADANVLVRAVRRGLVVEEIPVPMRPRQGGRSMHGGPDSVVFAGRMALLTVREALAPVGYRRTSMK
jgi:glycosyltransferase involved in cell wall biosynthesis